MSKLKKFRETPELISRWREARSILESIHFDSVMLELCTSAGDVPNTHPNLVEANALENQRRQGFMDALSFLFNADNQEIAKHSALNIKPDYNYAQTLLESGRITQAEYIQMMQEKD